MGFRSLLFGHKSKSEPAAPGPAPTVVIIGDRRHRTDIPYPLAKDFPEDNRLDFQHRYLKSIFGKTSFAPVDNPINVLDVGCGTGRWCIELAQHLPSTWVTGIDIEFHLPPVPIPQNCHFITGDILQRIPFPEQHFSFVHQRFLGSAIPLQCWPAVISELKRVCRSGGYVELFEGGGHFYNIGEHTQRFLSWWKLLCQERGIDTDQLASVGIWLKKAGLRNVTSQKMQVPIGHWGGRPGIALQNMCVAGWGGLQGMICEKVGVHPDVFAHTITSLPQEWSFHHTYYEYYSAFGQK